MIKEVVFRKVTEDARDMDDDGYRAVRDDIEARVRTLLASL